jgi:hypothetical protein
VRRSLSRDREKGKSVCDFVPLRLGTVRVGTAPRIADHSRDSLRSDNLEFSTTRLRVVSAVITVRCSWISLFTVKFDIVAAAAAPADLNIRGCESLGAAKDPARELMDKIVNIKLKIQRPFV